VTKTLPELRINKIRIGTAGWVLPSASASRFPSEGSHLERYAQVFNCVEINSSFYKDPRPDTYAKWAAATPDDFLFSVKLNKYFLQEKRLVETGDRLKQTLEGILQLQDKLGALLVQLPPSLAFEEKIAAQFMKQLRKHFSGTVVWEPRHKSWGLPHAIETLSAFQMNKVLADPEPCPTAKILRPQVENVRYLRLHGAPVRYRSSYTEVALQRITHRIFDEPISLAEQTWVIFDNTAHAHATNNALRLQDIAP
jgi:uncharacterized protein YecE (DUF72 family)